MKNLPANVGVSLGFKTWVQSLGLGRSPAGGRAWQPTPVFLPRNPMDRGAWRTTVPSVEKNQTRLKRLSTHMNMEVHVLFQISIFSRYIPRTGIVGSYGKSLFFRF